MRTFPLAVGIAAVIACLPLSGHSCAGQTTGADSVFLDNTTDTLTDAVTDSLATVDGTADDDAATRSGTLTERDYAQVAAAAGLDVATIKAVVEIEAGRTHQGFWKPGKPLINFDLSMFRRAAAKRGINLAKYQGSHAVVFARPNAARYGSQQAAQQARLDAARTIDNATAIEGTFWGMFQIGGFNWKKCGTADINEFVTLMSRSERDQLDLFIRFITNTGLLQHLRNKNWSAFAAGYNGPSYRSRGYHTKLAAAYAKNKH